MGWGGLYIVETREMFRGLRVARESNKFSFTRWAYVTLEDYIDIPLGGQGGFSPQIPLKQLRMVGVYALSLSGVTVRPTNFDTLRSMDSCIIDSSRVLIFFLLFALSSTSFYSVNMWGENFTPRPLFHSQQRVYQFENRNHYPRLFFYSMHTRTTEYATRVANPSFIVIGIFRS